MRIFFGIGVCVCSLALLIGCGDARTGDNMNGTGGTPGTGGAGNGARGTLAPGEHTCVTVVLGDEKGCSLDFFGSETARISGSLEALGSVLLSTYPEDGHVVVEGDVITESYHPEYVVLVNLYVPGVSCDGIPNAPGCVAVAVGGGPLKSYGCKPATVSLPAEGTFTLTFVEWNHAMGRYRLTLEATCPPNKGGTGDPVSGSMDLVIQR